MFIKLFVLIVFAQNSKAFPSKIISLLTPNNTEIPTNLIETWLTKPLKDVSYLQLMLRSNNYTNDVENAYTQWFLQQTHVPISLSDFELLDVKIDDMEANTNRENYVIVTSMQNLRLTVRQFAQKAGVFFFIVNGAIDLKELRDIFHIGWQKYQIFKNFMLTAMGVWIYDPFAIDEFGSYGKVIKYTGEKSIERTIFNDMRGYPLRVQIFKSVYSKPEIDPITKKVKYVYGVDGRVADLLQEHMNFTMDLQDPDPDYFGERNANGTYNGVIGSIIKNEVDLCITGFFIKDYMVPEMDFSVAVYDDQLCIYTPKAKQIPDSILPIFAVGYDLWLGFIMMAFICSFVWAVLRAFNLSLKIKQMQGGRLDKTLKWQYIRILIDTWVVWVRVNVVRFPPFNSERVFIASLCLVSVIFGAIFESSLATVFIHPIYYNDIHTMEELDESGLFVIYKYTSMADDLFFSETSTLFASLNKKLRHLQDLNADVLMDVAQRGGKAGVTRYTTLVLECLHFIVSKRIWIVPECPKYYTISYVWPKDAPWDETANQLLLRIQNAGLIKKFIADMQADVDIKIMKERLFESEGGFKIMTIEDLQLAFYVVIIGSLMASISLLVERKCRTIKKEVKINVRRQFLSK